jgi:hypothetical protein
MSIKLMIINRANKIPAIAAARGVVNLALVREVSLFIYALLGSNLEFTLLI